VDLSAGYRFDKTTQDNGVGDTTDDFINVGARGDFTPKLSGQIRVGVSTLMPAKGGGSNTTEPGLGMTLDYLLSPRTTLSLSADNGFTASALGTSQEELMINTSASFQLSQAWSASLGASFDSTKYLMVLPPRKDYFWVGDVGLSYAWTKYTAVQLSYFFRRNDSTLDAATFSDDVLTLSASSRF
jgi:long-subunit fatty acid transport protein